MVESDNISVHSKLFLELIAHFVAIVMNNTSQLNIVNVKSSITLGVEVYPPRKRRRSHKTGRRERAVNVVSCHT